MRKEKIIRNSARCLVCEVEIESTHRHDFVRCSCGSLAVDGGREYIRRAFQERAGWVDTSIIEVEGDGEDG